MLVAKDAVCCVRDWICPIRLFAHPGGLLGITGSFEGVSIAP